MQTPLDYNERELNQEPNQNKNDSRSFFLTLINGIFASVGFRFVDSNMVLLARSLSRPIIGDAKFSSQSLRGCSEKPTTSYTAGSPSPLSIRRNTNRQKSFS